MQRLLNMLPTPGQCRVRQPAMVAGAILALTTGQPVLGSRAHISGGADTSPNVYAWTVTNTHRALLVQVEFPNYRGALFFAPDGWTAECTSLADTSQDHTPGVCTARASPVGNGIASGRSATFRMQVAPAGAQRQRGRVLVRFADGAEESIADVEVPGIEHASDRHVPLLGLSIIFVLWLVARAFRRRRAHRTAADTEPGAGISPSN